MYKYLGKNLLVTIGDNDFVRKARMVNISPNGKYCHLDSLISEGECLGWQLIGNVTVIGFWDNERISQDHNYYTKWLPITHNCKR